MLIFFGVVLLSLTSQKSSKGNIGLVKIEGSINSSREIVKQLIDFRDNEHAKAILLRIDSPGGAITPSQEIYDEVAKTAKKKPVIVSMGSLAASGGYYVACPATRIVANPSTITGSIGVIMQHFIVEDLAKKALLHWDIIKAGEVKDIGSPLRQLTPKERLIFQNLANELHEQFISDIAKARKLKIEDVRSLATGEVFTGAKAVDLKLVDELGSEQRALEVAGKLAKVDKPKLIEISEPHGWLGKFLEQAFGGASSALLNRLGIGLQTMQPPQTILQP
jgi:protease-4